MNYHFRVNCLCLAPPIIARNHNPLTHKCPYIIEASSIDLADNVLFENLHLPMLSNFATLCDDVIVGGVYSFADVY